eukprot:7005227-Prymnesium_polylepis.1
MRARQAKARSVRPLQHARPSLRHRMRPQPARHHTQRGQGRRPRCRRREVALDTGRRPVGARRARSVRKERVRAHRRASVSRRGGKHAGMHGRKGLHQG